MGRITTLDADGGLSVLVGNHCKSESTANCVKLFEILSPNLRYCQTESLWPFLSALKSVQDQKASNVSQTY